MLEAPSTHRVSVIVVTYNGEQLIRRSLQCLKEQTLQPFEVIVVDNASTDHSVSIVRSEFPTVTIIEHPYNSGFSGGNLIGLKAAKGEYIALLNSDAFPEPTWLCQLREGMTSDPRIGICASKLLVDGSNLIDSAGDSCTTAFKGYKRGEMELQEKYDQRQFVFGACAGAALYRRAMIDEIGFFDEDFFLIHEDTDLNFRAQMAGWKCLFIPEARVRHRVRSTIGQDSPLAIYYTNRNADLVWVKNTPLPLMVRYFHHKLISDLGSLVYFGFRKRHLRTFFRAKWDVFKSLPALLKKRKQIRNLKHISNKQLAAMLTPIWSKGYLAARVQKLRKG